MNGAAGKIVSDLAGRWYEDWEDPGPLRGRVLFSDFGGDLEINILRNSENMTAIFTVDQAREMRDWLNQFIERRKE